jgi:hypothetical protein
MKRKSIAIITLILVIIGIAIPTSYFFVNSSLNSKTIKSSGNSIDRIIHLDESHESQPYDQLASKYGTADFIMCLSPDGGLSSYGLFKLLVTDDQMIIELGLNDIKDLYCKNNTSCIFYGDCHWKGSFQSVGTDMLTKHHGFWNVLQSCSYSSSDNGFKIMLSEALHLDDPTPSGRPIAPILLSATQIAGSLNVKLDFTLETGNIGYNIYRSTNQFTSNIPDSSFLITTIGVQTEQPSYIDSSTSLRIYYYAITVLNEFHESYLSNKASTTVVAIKLPSPINVKATELQFYEPYKVQVTWDKVAGATGYKVYGLGGIFYSANPSYLLKTITDPSITSYDQIFYATCLMYFGVTAIFPSGESDISTIISIWIHA